MLINIHSYIYICIQRYIYIIICIYIYILYVSLVGLCFKQLGQSGVSFRTCIRSKSRPKSVRTPDSHNFPYLSGHIFLANPPFQTHIDRNDHFPSVSLGFPKVQQQTHHESPMPIPSTKEIAPPIGCGKLLRWSFRNLRMRTTLICSTGAISTNQPIKLRM